MFQCFINLKAVHECILIPHCGADKMTTLHFDREVFFFYSSSGCIMTSYLSDLVEMRNTKTSNLVGQELKLGFGESL